MKDVKFIYFDLGYTLVDETDAWQTRYAKQCALEESISAKITPKILFENMKIASANRAPSPYGETLKKFGIKCNMPYCPDGEKVYPEAADVLRQLKKHYRLGLLANQVAGTFERLRHFGIADFFDVVVASSDYKLAKPDLRLFEIAAQKAQCSPNQIVMVGDRLDNDILPAKAMGWKTIWIKQGFGAAQSPVDKTDTPDFAVSSLWEIPAILGCACKSYAKRLN